MTRETKLNQPWLDWAIELQSLAQNSLEYSKNIYDIEPFQRLRELAAEMMAYQTEVPKEKAYELFCTEKGYQTPKIDTRAAGGAGKDQYGNCCPHHPPGPPAAGLSLGKGKLQSFGLLKC